MPVMPGMPPAPSGKRNSARMLKRLKQSVADDRGAMTEIRRLLTQRGYHGVQTSGDVVEALGHLLEELEGGRDLGTTPALAAPAPALAAPAPASPMSAPLDPLAAMRAALGVSMPSEPTRPSLCLPNFTSLASPPLVPQPAPQPVPQMAPQAAPQMTPQMTPQAAPQMAPQMAPAGAPHTGPLDLHSFEAKFKANSATAAASNLAEANGAPRPKGEGGARFKTGGSRPNVNEQYAILERVTGKKAAPAPPSGIPNALAR